MEKIIREIAFISLFPSINGNPDTLAGAGEFEGVTGDLNLGKGERFPRVACQEWAERNHGGNSSNAPGQVKWFRCITIKLYHPVIAVVSTIIGLNPGCASASFDHFGKGWLSQLVVFLELISSLGGRRSNYDDQKAQL